MSKYYRVDREVGRGANGVVSAVTHLQSGRVFACKTIPKQPDSASDAQKIEEHLQAVRREIKVLKMLRSCLNVAKLEEVYEDETCVHIIQELCTGGELAHSVGQRHYSERTVRAHVHI
jgi:calcium-dependent protein kinase